MDKGSELLDQIKITLREDSHLVRCNSLNEFHFNPFVRGFFCRHCDNYYTKKGQAEDCYTSWLLRFSQLKLKPFETTTYDEDSDEEPPPPKRANILKPRN